MTPIPEPRREWFEPIVGHESQAFTYHDGRRPIYEPMRIPRGLSLDDQEAIREQDKRNYLAALERMRDLARRFG
jgi:hypothetical protein